MDNDKRKAGKIGGARRAEILAPRRRSQIAREAALARWAKPARATHRGSFKEDFGIDVECFVLDDEQKTAVLSQRGISTALRLGDGGSRLPRFITTDSISPYLGDELLEKLKNPIIFQVPSAGKNAPPMTVHGYDAAVLIDLCNTIIRAEAAGKLLERQKPIATQAHIILGASAKAGIKGLVYALAGYSPAIEEVIAAFKLYVQEEARKYEPEFPNEIYVQWHRLYDIPVPIRGKPWHFKYLTVRHIYHPLAQSSGKLYALLKALKAQDGDRAKKLFQFLNEIGARALRIHLGRVLEMAESSPTRQVYENKIVERFGGQKELDLVLPKKGEASVQQQEAAN